MRRVVVLLAGLAVFVICPAQAMGGVPQRVVSLDLCADQWVLQFVDRDRIAGVSPDAKKDISLMRDRAKGIRHVRPTAEDVLSLDPDLVVRAYGGDPMALRYFQRAGIDVVQIPWADDVEAVLSTIEIVASDLGAAEAGRVVAAKVSTRLGQVPSRSDKRILYLTPGGVTAGPGTLIDDLIGRRGFANFASTPGWSQIDLERLVTDQPDVTADAFFDEAGNDYDRWSLMRHPVARQTLMSVPGVTIPAAYVACPNWAIADIGDRLNSLGEVNHD